MPTKTPPFVWTFLLLANATVAQAGPDPDRLWEQARKLPPAQQDQALTHLRSHLPDHPLVRAWTGFAAAATHPQHEREKSLAHKRPKKGHEFPNEPERLPRRVDYLFGVGTIVRRDGKPLPVANPAKTGKKPEAKVPDPLPLHHALLGCCPDADMAVAAMLQRLDQDHGGDAFAAFLQSWRNGDESFYEALDRTAGTADSVFFYDVMLGDFRTHFGKGKDGATVDASLQAAHDALHEAFLAYRNYRAFREAVAWSLVLPPDVPLPPRLSRYEAKVEGSYSLRQQVLMVAAALDHDLAKVVAAVTDDAAALPRPLWRGKCDPHAAWAPKFTALQQTMIARAGSTDAFLQQAERERRELASQLARLGAEAVQVAKDNGKAH
ncbi:MAG: hypothetical protein IPK26_25055 [Planctomycetes bacterium]|nr:hypothetical protein [Planctomycetota bacterium]